MFLQIWLLSKVILRSNYLVTEKSPPGLHSIIRPNMHQRRANKYDFRSYEQLTGSSTPQCRLHGLYDLNFNRIIRWLLQQKEKYILISIK